MCQVINPGSILNEYIKSCGYTVKDFSKLLNISPLELNKICNCKKDMPFSMLAKLSLLTKVPYREWHDIFWEYKAYKYSQLILDKFPLRIKNSINKLVGYD
jgi:hypothetical protein